MDKLKSIAVPLVRKRGLTGIRAVPASSSDAGSDHRDPRRAPSVPAGTHRYRIGQRLRIVGSGRNWGRVDGLCKVVALMPHEAGPFLYRVRTDTENFERVVAESDLATFHAGTSDSGTA